MEEALKTTARADLAAAVLNVALVRLRSSAQPRPARYVFESS